VCEALANEVDNNDIQIDDDEMDIKISTASRFFIVILWKVKVLFSS
jgi:hypothetical protein